MSGSRIRSMHGFDLFRIFQLYSRQKNSSLEILFYFCFQNIEYLLKLKKTLVLSLQFGFRDSLPPVLSKVLANEDTLLPTQMFPRLPARATFVAGHRCF